MRPAPALAALLVSAFLAGCGDSGPPPDIPGLGSSVAHWTEARSPAWVAASWGCGFCSGSEDAPEFRLVVLHEDGSAAAVDYALDRDGAGVAVDRIGLGPYGPLLEDIFRQTRPYATERGDGSGTQAVRVLGVATARMAPEAFEPLRARLQEALDDPGTPGSQEVTFTDCGPEVIEVLRPDRVRATSGCGVEPGEGWVRVQAEMHALDAWVRGEGDRAIDAGGAALVPNLAPIPGTAESAAIVAALHLRACGGLLHGCSGASGVVVYADGRVHAFWGSAWEAGAEGRTFCTAGDPLHDLDERFGPDWEVPCAEDFSLRQPRSGQVPQGAWANLSARLATLDPPDVPASLQEQGCCDRVFTVVRFHLDGEQGHIVVEGTDVRSDAEPLPLVPLVGQLLALQQWMGPSDPSPWSQSA